MPVRRCSGNCISASRKCSTWFLMSRFFSRGRSGLYAALVGRGDEAVLHAVGRRDVVIYPAMFVVGDENGRAFPQIAVAANCVVNSRQEDFTLLYVVIWVLVAGDDLAAIAFVIAVVRFN